MIARLVLVTLGVSLAGGCNFAATAQNDRQEKNLAALAKAHENIGKLRKGPARIKVFDADGKPANNVKLEIRQVSHAFKFGCYLKIDDLDPVKLPAYEQRFKKLFNYAVIGNYWDNIENKRGD